MRISGGQDSNPQSSGPIIILRPDESTNYSTPLPAPIVILILTVVITTYTMTMIIYRYT